MVLQPERSAALNAGEIGFLAKVDEQIFDLRGPMFGKCVFETCAERPAKVRMRF